MRETKRFACVAALAAILVAAPAAGSASAREGRAWIGVDVSQDTACSWGGVLIESVHDDSPARAAGLLDGDVIVEVDGDAVRDPAALRSNLRDREVGDSVTLSIVRERERMKIEVELGAMPRTIVDRVAPGGEPAIVVPEFDEAHRIAIEDDLERLREQGGAPWAPLDRLEGRPLPDGRRLPAPFAGAFGPPILGVHLVDVTPELRRHFGTDREAGVLVGRVLEDSAADVAGILVGDLILAIEGEEVADSGALAAAIRTRAGTTVSIELLRNGRSLTLAVVLPRPEVPDFRTPRAARAPGAPIATRPSPPPPAPPDAPRRLLFAFEL